MLHVAITMPFWAGLLVFLGLYQHRLGIFVPLLGGIVAASALFAQWRVAFNMINSGVMRGLVALSYDLPPTRDRLSGRS